MRLGIPNWSAPLFPRPAGSPLKMTVVGTPLFILRIPPICHPPSAVLAKPLKDFAAGKAQRALIAALWAMLKSERPRSDFGANQYKELRLLPNVSPAIVAESSSIDFDQVKESLNWMPWLIRLSISTFMA